MAADSRWESVVKQLTGFDGGTRVNVAAVGGADAAAGDGSEWMLIGISHSDGARETTPDLESPGAKLGRTLKFYGPPASSSNNVQVYTVQLNLPWSSSSGADWSDTGNAGAYDWGYGQALRMLRDEHRTAGFGAEYPHTKAVADEDSVDLRTFPATARAFDRVTAYFRGRSPVLEQWVKDLDGEYAAYRGSGADVFRDLIDALGTGYKDLLSDLSSAGGSTVSVSDPSYRPDSVVSDRILEAELAVHNAASTLCVAWDSWVATGLWLGTAHLDKLLDEVALWLNENNIRRMQQNGAGASQAGAGFLTTHPVYGDLTKEESWKALSRAACSAWTATLSALDTAAQRAMLDLNQAMMVPGTSTGFTFTPGIATLAEANASDEAAKAKEDAQKQMDDLAKGGPGTSEPGLGDDGDTSNPFATGDEESATGPGGDGTTSAIPPLGPNGTGDGSSFGLDGATSTNPDGSLTTANPDGSRTTANPDGSLTTTNPDGSHTTTFPDGHQETTPAGVLPPALGLNGTGAPGLGSTTARTVKGPGGSTTTYNPDGSRTVAHKDGTTTTVRPDGSMVTDNPDGSRTVLNKDGSETVTYQDGTKTTIGTDGSTLTRYADGSSAKLSPDGTVTTTDPQGHSTVSHPRPGAATHNPDGSTTAYGEDGTTTTTHADGTKTTVASNGTVTTVDPDGTKTVSHLGKGTSTVQYADGSVARIGADGTVSTTYKDGSTTKLGPDGTYTATDADGHRTIEQLNPTGGTGSLTTHHADGSATTTYPDGTVDTTLKDGGHRISYPDGRTVTTDAYGRTTGTVPELGTNGSADGWGDYDYYDYPDGAASDSLGDGGYGPAVNGDGAAGGPLPPLGLNPLGGQGLTAGTTAAAGAGALGERTRSLAVGDAASARGARSAQLAAEEAAAMRRPATTSSGTPMMPPMGGMGGGAGTGTQSAERERSTWVSEDEETWGTDEGGVSAVIGR
ncbi:AAWKG family protein [Streptomyces sp. DT224]|uniref:AAWKG family protein n=1 Tax=Streptomyces sp. DT224 TaxID=3393426 RepID=UPI003CF10FAB